MRDEKFYFTALSFSGLLFLIHATSVIYSFDLGFNASTSPLWKFFVSVLGHSGWEHLMNNLFFIAVFGSIFERLTSGKTFLAVFFISAWFANLSAFIFFMDSFIIGASGGAFGILAALTVIRPKKIGLALGIPVPMWAALALYTLTNLAGIGAATGTAHEAHLLGIVAGGLIGLALRDKKEENGREDLEEPEINNWREKIREWEDKWMLN